MPQLVGELGSELRKDTALLPVRGALGAAMVYHGLEKLKGEGPEQTGQWLEQLEIKPGKAWGIATGASELFAGLGVLLGMWTRPAAIAVLVTQAVAVWKVHAKNGFDIGKKGFEYNLALMAIACGLLIAGPGRVSAHEGLEHLVEGKGAKKLFRKARPPLLLRAIRLIK